MVICKHCGIDKEDNKQNRYYYRGKRHGLKCKECVNRGRKSEHERELARIRDANRYLNSLERRNYIFNKNYARRNLKGYGYAHSKTSKKISELEIRPSICPICGYEGRIVAHHPDINVWNKIVFCCPICHDKIHREKIECPQTIDLLSNNF